MYASLSEVKIAPQDVEQYVLMRRLHINPVLREQPGFLGTTLLKAREQPSQEELTFALFNYWADSQSADAWAVAPVHDEVSEYVIPLVRSITSKRYERVDDASLTIGDETAGTGVGRIAIQRVMLGRVDDYLAYRRDVIHPSMAEADGFVSAWTLRDVNEPNVFAVYFRWASDEASDAYFHLPFHLGEITDRVTDLLEVPPKAGARYDVVAVEQS